MALVMGCGSAAEPPATEVAPPSIVPPPETSLPPPETPVLAPATTTLAPPASLESPPISAVPGFAVEPFPLVLRGVARATLARDPADPQAVVVHGDCDVRVAEPQTGIGGARAREMLAGIGATFSTDEVADDHWALAYTIGSTMRAIQYGLVDQGHTYVCRGDFASAEAQACGAALCASLAATGGPAGTLAHEGGFVASCAVGDLCLQAHEDASAAHQEHCAIVQAPIARGPCPTERPVLGTCTMPDGMQWVYYGGGQLGSHFARTRCGLDHGTFAAN